MSDKALEEVKEVASPRDLRSSADAGTFERVAPTRAQIIEALIQLAQRGVELRVQCPHERRHWTDWRERA